MSSTTVKTVRTPAGSRILRPLAGLVLVLMALTLGATSIGHAQEVAQDAAGTWVGAIEIPGSPLGVQVTLSAEGDDWSGTIDIPAQGAVGAPLDAVTVDGDDVSFAIAGVPGAPTFTGTVSDDAITGTFTQAGQSFPFSLARPDEAADDDAGAGAQASEYSDPQGRFSLQVPAGWTATEHDGFVRVEGPEGGIRVDVVVSEEGDPESAVAQAWTLTEPDTTLEPFQTLEPPSDPGVDRTVVMNYDVGDPSQIYQAVAQVVGDETYVLLVYGELGMLQRRNAQLQIVATSFEITSVEDVDLSGVEPRPVAGLVDEFEAFVTSTMDAYSVPGASIAIVQGGEVVYTEGFGVTEAGDGEPVTPATQMMIGSTGKTMTSMLIASLVDDGIIDWDTPVVDVLPRFAVADEELTPQITFRNLLCACTGVPRRDVELAFNYDELSAEAVVESLREFEFFTDFGEAFQYSNQLVATAGYAAAAAAGAPYGQLYEGYVEALDERVLEPIGMEHTTLDFDEVKEAGEYALPHQLSLESGEYEPIDLSFEELLVPVGPAGAHWSTAEDMARYLQTVLNVGVAPDGDRVVSEENLLVTWEPQVPISATDSYALGWIVSDYHGLPMLSHGGNTIGFTSEFLFLPEADLGIVVVANAQVANPFTGAVTARLLELVYDQPAEIQAQTDFQVEQIEQRLTEQREQLVDRVPLADALRYFGAYSNPALGEVSLRLEDGQLMLDAGEWSMKVRPYLDREGEFESYVTYGAPLSGLTLRLMTDDEGAQTMVLGDGIVSYTFERLR